MRIAGLHLDNPLSNALDPEAEEPIGLEYVLSVVKNDSHEVRLFLNWDKEEKLFTDIKDYNPDVIFLEVYTKDFPEARRIARLLKAIKKDLLIVVGGYHPTALPIETLEESEGYFDICVIGEGEETAKELLNDIETENGNLKAVKGIAFRENGEIHITPPRDLIKNIDTLPWPIREPRFYDLKSPCLYYPESSKLRFAPVIHSRGCRRSCYFCASESIWGGTPRFREPKEVVKEMNYLNERYGINFFYIEDLSINVDEDELSKLCDEMIAHLNLNIYWASCANIGISTKVLKKIKSARCVCLSYGVESLDPNSLEICSKDLSLEKIRTALHETASMGILNYVFYMIGFENETEESIRIASSRLSQLPIHRLRVTIATPLPGSKWYDRIDKSRLDSDWSKYDTMHPVILDHNISQDRLKELSEEIIKKFYKSQGYMKNKNNFLRENPIFKKSFDEFLSNIN